MTNLLIFLPPAVSSLRASLGQACPMVPGTVPRHGQISALFASLASFCVRPSMKWAVILPESVLGKYGEPLLKPHLNFLSKNILFYQSPAQFPKL